MSELNTLPPVARKVFYPCKKCEVDRYQVVLTHTDAKTAKLECEVCHSKNTMKIGPVSAKSKAGKAAAAGKPRGHKVRWEQLTQKPGISPVPYSMKTAFEVDSVIQHPKFGLGVVTALTNSSVQVVFEDQERSLVHNRG